jgi:hypothetical protein
LTHNGLPDDEMGRGHEEGWKHFTGILAEKIKGLWRGAETPEGRREER